MGHPTFPNPQTPQITVIFDEESGVWRPVLKSDYTSTQNINIKAPNGQDLATINPLPVKMGGGSASSFGEVMTVSPTVEIEGYLESCLDSREWEIFTGANDGYVDIGTGMANFRIGESLLAYTSVRSRNFVPYSPGKGVTVRFTAAFNSGVANSLQLVGPYHAEDGFGVGYDGENFGVFHRYGRKQHIQKLSITSAASIAGTGSIVINGTPNIFRVDAAGNIWDDARNIASGTTFVENSFFGTTILWETQAISGNVYFTRNSHGPITGEFSFNSGTTNLAATFSQFQSGVDGNLVWTYQSGFSYDALSGSGPSSMTINPQKLNVYEVKYGWLGALPVKFSVANEVCQEFVPFHVTRWANLNETPHIEDPRFPVAYSVASVGSSTIMNLKGASVYAAVEGANSLKHKMFTFDNEQAASTTETSILAVLCSRVDKRGQKINRRRFFVDNINLTNESSTKAAKVRVYIGSQKNLKTFSFSEPDPIDSPVSVSKIASQLNNGSSLELLDSIGVAPQETANLAIQRYILPKEVVIVTISTSSSTANILATINGHEDV